jgi:ankyrin repeat protein
MTFKNTSKILGASFAAAAALTLGLAKANDENILRYGLRHQNQAAVSAAEFLKADRDSALHGSALAGKLEDVDSLLTYGARPTTWTVALTAQKGNLPVLKKLYTVPIDTSVMPKEDPDVAGLAYAASEGRIDVMEYFLDKGVDPDAKKGWALWLAIVADQREAVDFLLNAGASPNPKGNQPLSAAILEAAKVLDVYYLNRLLATGRMTAQDCEEGLADIREFGDVNSPHYRILTDYNNKLKAPAPGPS